MNMVVTRRLPEVETIRLGNEVPVGTKYMRAGFCQSQRDFV